MRFAAPFSTFSFCAFALLAGSRASGATDASLDALLAKSRAASGAPYRYHVVSRSRETEDGRDYEVTTETEGLKYLARKCLGTLCPGGFYFDGDRSFDTNFNDTALPLSARVDGLQLTLRAIASYAFTAPSFRSDGGQVQRRDDVMRDGKPFRRVAVAPRLGAFLEAVIDPDSGLVVGVVSEERGLAFEFRDQRKVGDRITLPYSVYLNGKELERFDDRSIDAAPLAPPPGLVPKIPGNVTSVSMTRSDAPLVPCTLGGASVTCLFDTGNSGLAISAELAARLRLKPQPLLALTAGKAPVAGVAKAPVLSVGGATFAPAQYVVLQGLHAAGYDVVLGADVFAHARVTLDFQKRSVTLASVNPPPANTANAVPLDFANFVPSVALELAGDSVQLSVDTGDASTLELAADYAAAHALEAAATSVRLGDDRLSGLQVGTTKRLSAPDTGVIGSGLLQHFVATFDYARTRLELMPRSGDPAVKAGD
jgi:hypothetical protein